MESQSAMDTKNLIQKLQLKPHPEGGHYKETYRAEQKITAREGKERNICTAIYYLLENKDKSHFHRIRSEELWFFHQGQPLEIVFIQDGKLNTIVLGNDIAKGEEPQAKVPAYTWFAARIKNESGYSLISCTVSPGFDFSDFEMAKKDDLLNQFPHLKEAIEKFAL